MPGKTARAALALPLILALGSCGDQSLFLSPKAGASDLQIVSASDGQVFASGKTIPLMISAQDASSSRDVEVEVTVAAPDGSNVWHNRAAAVLNEQSPVTLPTGLAPGLYRMDLVLYSSGQAVQKKTVSFFVAPEGWKITGIRSFPPVITSAATVMLKAELDIPADANPWLRWSWKGKVIQKGTLSSGLGEILWDVPGESGVYTVTLELFPAPPAPGTDFTFTSSLSLSTDIVVTGNAAPPLGRLGPASSFLTLLRLQASLADSGAGAKKAGKLKASAIGTPAVVSLENGFGYQLDGTSGISVPWLALPLTGGSLGPFTISIGVSFDDLASANRIVSVSTSDGSFSLVLAMNPRAASPEARISGAGAAPVVVPWGGPPLTARQRSLLSLSLTPAGSGFTAQWFLDGVQVSRTAIAVSIGAAASEGSITIGGDEGFRGIVDEFGVYAWDAAGRPSTDPDLYLRGQSAIYGSRLAFASGFDAASPSAGFTVEGSGQLAGGVLDLPPGARLLLPTVRTGDALTVTAGLSAASGRAAALIVQWQGSSQPAALISLSTSTSELSFQVSADGRTITARTTEGDKTTNIPPGATGSSALVLAITDPADTRTDLQLDTVLAVKGRK